MFHKRPEKDTVNPPGQILNEEQRKRDQEAWKRYENSRYAVPAKYLKDIIKRIEDEESCCHQTMILGTRCEGCPHAKPDDKLIPRRE